MSRAHARLAPSAGKRWFSCPGSVNRVEAKRADLEALGLDPDAEEKSSPAAEFGIASHKYLQDGIETWNHPEDLLPSNASPEQQEQAHLAGFAYDHVMERLKGMPQALVSAEAETYPGAMIGRKDCWGRCDVTTVDDDTLIVSDYKSGFIVVEANDPQVLMYMLGKVYAHGGRNASFKQVIGEVIQPRGNHPDGPIRQHVMTVEELCDWGEQVLAAKCATTDLEDAPIRPSEEACRFCPVKAECPELMATAQAALVGGSESGDIAEKMSRPPGELTPEELQFVLDNERLITGWLKAVKAHAVDTLKAGGAVPGWKLVAGRKTHSWVEDQDIGKALTNTKGTDGKKIRKAMVYTESVVSPAQAEKRIKPLVSPKVWERIEGLISVSQSGLTLAPVSDKRPSVIERASDIFTPVADETIDLSFLE